MPVLSRKNLPARIVAAPAEMLCLDYANTLCWRGSEKPVDSLAGFDQFIAWCAAAPVLDRGLAASLRAWGASRPLEASRLFEQAIRVRELLYRMLGNAATNRDVRCLNELLAVAPNREEIAPNHQATGWRVPAQPLNVEGLLAPVLWSAADLLLGTRLELVRRCDNEKCQWLFLDDSKGGTRRWCSMGSCGNRAKAQRHYLRRVGRLA